MKSKGEMKRMREKIEDYDDLKDRFEKVREKLERIQKKQEEMSNLMGGDGIE